MATKPLSKVLEDLNKPQPGNLQNFNKTSSSSNTKSVSSTPQQSNPKTPEFSYQPGSTSVGTLALPDGKVFVGINKRDAEGFTNSYLKNQNPVQGAVPLGTSQAQAEMQATQQQQQQQALEQPVTSDLSVPSAENNPISKVPVVGSMVGALSNVVGGVDVKAELRRKTISKIQRKVFEDGVSANEKFGAVIESIPVIGSLVNKFARGLIDTPSGNVDNLVEQLNTVYKQALEQQKYAKLSPEFKDRALSNVDTASQNIEELEAKMKLASIYSAELRSNPDDLELVERKIITARTKLLRIRLNIISGADPLTTSEDLIGDFSNE
jgi:hypothetical protein